MNKSEVVNHTPNGREVRREVLEDGSERFCCQPPHDNYWVAGRTPKAAVRNAGWPRSVVDGMPGRDWEQY